MTKITSTIGFIGAGVMAQAIGKSLLESDIIDPALCYVSAPSNNNLGWWKDVGFNTTNDNNVIINKCEIVLLLMKPQYLEKALTPIKENNANPYYAMYSSSPDTTLFISILAGFSISQLKQILYKYLNFSVATEEIQIFRVVPNTAIVVGSGCTVYCYNTGPSLPPTQVNEKIKLVETIFSAGGLCVHVPEEIINSVSALSGSGIAYIFVMIEALSDGAVKMGVPRALALQLAAQTFLGAAKMVQVTGKHPGALKDDVCSAGGTTIAAIHVIEKAGVRAGLIDAIEAAVKRSNELSNRK